MGKKRIVKKFEMLSEELAALVNEEYPDGYEENVITFQTATGELATGFPLETEEAYYLIKLPKDVLPSEDDEDDTIVPSKSESSIEGPEFVNLDSLPIADELADDE